MFIGIMVSLGSSASVGQIISGLILQYSRTFKQGDYVRIGETEGVVIGIGLFSTKIETIQLEEISIPNAVAISNVTKNYSRFVKDRGVILSTNVTIGYSTPWRQTHAMLLMAADRTPGIGQQTPPFVYQTALSDYYVEYRLHVFTDRPEERIPILAALHANIQDVFNEYGVQIMSPHYVGDPAEKVWVSRENWYEPPAQPPDRL